ncbi:MAG: amino acid adenylation domain-containing protein [Rhodococcus sp.]|nr:amino acid adenylation domain-containing protein [Rhodococcus sp. (in: high G+C Gram-positive bacteria)]
MANRCAIEEETSVSACAGDPALQLTRAQSGVWFAQQLAPDNPIFNTSECIELRGDVDLAAAARAIRLAADESEVLVAAFETLADGTVVQYPGRRALADPPIVDLRAETDPWQAAQDWMTRDLAQVIDPAADLCVRAAVLQVADDRVVLYLCGHHLVLDAYGFGLFNRRIAEHYTASVTDGEVPAARFTQVEPVVAEEADYRDSEAFAADREFWAAYLADIEEAATLRPGPGGIARRSCAVRFTLDAEQQRALAALGRTVRGAWGDAVTALVAAYLRTATGREDLTIGFPVMNRLGSAALNVPMSAVNVVPMRLHPTAADTMSTLVGQVRESIAACRDHYRYRGEDIQRDLRLPAGSRGVIGPSVNVKPFGDVLRFGQIRGSVHSVARGPLQDFMITVRPLDESAGLEVFVDGDADVYARDDLHVHAARLEHLFATVADIGHDTPLARVRMLGDDEYDRILREWAGPVEIAVDPDLTLTDLLHRQVTENPDRAAVADADTTLTFAQFASRVNVLARRLIAHRGPARPEHRIAIAVPRTVDALVAIFAVLESGAAYVPLDVDQPVERLAHVLADSAPGCVLTTVATDARIASIPHAPERIRLDDPDTVDLPDDPVTDGERGLVTTPDSTAYVIHTSGSTGRPKGVLVPHRGLVHLFHSHRAQVYSRAAHESGRDHLHVGHAWSFAFDASWQPQLWMLAGHTVHIVDEVAQRDATLLAAQAARENWDFVELSPAQLEQILDDELLPAASVPTVGFGGDAVTERLWQELRTRHGAAFNFYGPTECTVDSLVADVRDSDTPVVGRPVANLRAHILDSGLAPVPPGVEGELYLSGPGVVRGYLGAPAATASRFVANPFAGGETAHARLYRTGDRGLWTGDGRIVYRGRGDGQVKVRGFRIELGEVDTALLRLPGVARAVTVARTDASGIARLVAYLVGDDVPEPAVARTLLGEWLPGYMVPSAIVALDELPLTANGKLDRRALPAPDFAALVSSRAPETELERALCGIYADILGLDSVGADDDFFALGGHSLSAAKLLARIRNELGVEPTIRSVFDHPVVADLAAACADAEGTVDRPLLVPQRRGDLAPLSHAQQRLWFLFAMEGPSPTYNVPVTVRLHGALDHDALRRAVGDVLTRHESLRTVLLDRDGTGMQRVLDVPGAPGGPETPFAVVPVTEDTLDAELVAQARHGFDLEHEVPLRVRLLTLGPDESVLLLLAHHVASDELSTPLLMRDLGGFYAARTGDAPYTPEPLPVQYADFAIWQRTLLGELDDENSLAARQVAFWRDRLAGLPTELDLVTDRPRPTVASYAGGSVEHTVPARLADAVRAAGRDTGTTMFMMVHAAVALALSHSGAGDDIPLGSPTAGRPAPELDDLVGFFVNMVVLRTDLTGDPTVRELLGRIRDSDLAAYANQDVSFDRVVDALNPERSAARHPLFQVMVQYQSPPALTAFADLAPSVSFVSNDTAMFDLSFDVIEAPGGSLRVRVEYARELYDESTAAAFAGRVVRAFAALAGDPERRVSRLDLLGDDERAWLCAGRPGAAVAPLADLPDTLHGLFARSVASTPHDLAMVSPTATTTFTELDVWSNRIARYLVDRGVGAESVVALMLPRDGVVVAAILGVWKAGGAYLAIDPNHPDDRIEFMLRDAAATVVLDPAAIADAQRYPGGPLADTDVRSPARTDNAAYVVYTSGSTGTPKGVVVPHRGVVNLWETVRTRTFGDPTVTRRSVLLSYTFTFDSSMDPLLAMLGGHAVHVLAEDLLADAEAIVAYVRDRRIDGLDCGPVLMTQLVAHGLLDPGAAHRPAIIALGGEAVPAELWSTLATAPDLHAVNMYGPTECTVDSAGSVLTADTGPHIGVPIEGGRALVLDRRLRPVPPGVAGELYIGGPHVTRGYLGRPGMSSGRFVADPFGRPGARLYRTGDVVRWAGADPVLEYLGRSDDQVKIRGFRVEPGEIEAVLAAHPTVAGVVVIAREDEPGRTRLVGYVVAEPDAVVDTDELRGCVAARLPEHMVPAAIVVLDAFPVTANGKIDRNALPAPVFAPTAAARPPVDDTERRLCAVIAAVLGLHTVGPDDDFFALGGDSIVSIQLVSKARAAGLRFTARHVFEHRTAAGLRRVAEVGAVAGAVDAAAASGTVPATPIVHDMLDRGGPYDRYAQSRLLRTPAGLTVATLTDAVQALLDVHDALRSVFDGHARALEVSPVGAVRAADVITVVDVAGVGDLSAVIGAATQDAYGRLAPSAGVLVQVVFFDAGPGREGRILIAVHHLVVDGVSWRILVPDLVDAVAGRALVRSGTPLRAWAKGLLDAVPTRRAEAALWQRMTAPHGRVSVAARAIDPSRDTMSGTAVVHVEVPSAVTDALLTTVPERFHARIDDVLLTALALATSRARGSGALVVDLEGHGREEQVVDGADLSRTVGWFTTMYPVRLDVTGLDVEGAFAGSDVAGEALKRIKEQLREIPDNGIGFGMLRHLDPDRGRDLAVAAAPEIGFNYLGRFTLGESDGGPWSGAPEAAAMSGATEPAMPVSHAVEIGVLTEDTSEGPVLRGTFGYSPGLVSEQLVATLAEYWVGALGALAGHAEVDGAGGFTPSDLTLTDLDQSEIDEFSLEFG